MKEHVISVVLPERKLKKGYNELRIVTRQRSILGLCRDIDNPGNWVRFSERSAIELPVRRLRETPLAFYPLPYLDPLAKNPVNCTWLLPPKPAEADITAMLTMAANWGMREPERDLPIRVTTADPSTVAGNQILIGELKNWQSLVTQQLAPGVGWLENLPVNAPGQPSRLVVTGLDAEGLAKAASAPSALTQMEAQQSAVTIAARHDFDIGALHYGTTTLKEMGIPYLKLNGAFHQSASLVLKRPIRCDLGRDSSLRVYFRNAATLNPLRSILTVYVNRVPAASSVLGPNTSQLTALDVPIPITELQKNTWTVDFSVYHDLGTIDCSKVYDDVAWTLIDGKTSITLRTGELQGKPSLDHFPYVSTSDGKVLGPVTVWLPSNPTDVQLTLAAMVALRAGQENRQTLEWRAALGDTVPADAKKAGSCVIMLGALSEANRWADLRGKLLLFPESASKLAVNERVYAMPDIPFDVAILQAVPSPWQPGSGMLYCIMASNDTAFRRLREYMIHRDAMTALTGEATILTPLSRMVNLTTSSPEQTRAEIKREEDRYTAPMWLIVVLILVLVVLVLRWIVRLFVPKGRRPRRSEHTTVPPQGSASV